MSEPLSLRAQLMRVLGQPGTGKSSLVEAVFGPALRVHQVYSSHILQAAKHSLEWYTKASRKC